MPDYSNVADIFVWIDGVLQRIQRHSTEVEVCTGKLEKGIETVTVVNSGNEKATMD